MFLGLIILFLILSPKPRFLTVLGLSIFCGGSLSNLIDRITLGEVVDFLNFSLTGLRPYTFNLADIEIGAGITIAVLSNFLNLVRGASSKFILRAR